MVGVMMKFPRKPDGTLDFKAFSNLPLELQKEAFTDLKTNGTAEERTQFQEQRRIAQQQRAQKEAEIARINTEMEEKIAALHLREAQVSHELKQEVVKVVSATFLPSSAPKSTPSAAPSARTPAASSLKK
jgi:hypothetical protein